MGDASTNIGNKRMGEIDVKPFQNACKQKYSPDEAEVQATAQCSLWQELLKNPNWHPFKIINVGGTHEVCCLYIILTLYCDTCANYHGHNLNFTFAYGINHML